MGGGALFLAALDFSINVNLPNFRTELGETLISVQLIIIMYHGARSGTGFIAGDVADRIGIKWPLVAGIILYTLAVGLISLQGSLITIVALRIPQGIGVAILFTLGPALVTRAFGQSRRGIGLGVILAAMGAGTLVGTLGGGFLGQQIGWPAIFWARVPIGAILLITTIIWLNGKYAEPVPDRSSSRFDLFGSILLFVTLFVLVLAISFARVEGWIDPIPITLFVLSAMLGFAFTRGKKSGLITIIPSGLMDFNGFKPGAASHLLLTVAAFVMWFLFPFYITDVMGGTGLVLGAILALMAAMNLAGSVIGGWLADSIGDRKIIFAGAAITAIGLAMAGTTGDTPAMSAVMLATATLGLGFGIHQAAVYALALRAAPQDHAGAASAALSVTQTIGTVLSIALMTSLLNWRMSAGDTFFDEAYRFSFVTASAIAMAAGLIVARRTYKHPAATLKA